MTTRQVDPFEVESMTADTSQPVLALHGIAGNSTQWQDLSERLGCCYRVIVPDLPDNGDAHAHPSGDARSIADRLVGHWPELCSKPAHLIGQSLGATVALEIALLRPDLVNSMTLIEPAPFHLLRGGQASDLKLFEELGGLTEWMAASVLADTPTAGMRAYVDYWHGNSTWHRTSEHRRESLTRQTARVAIDLGASLAKSWSAAHCNALNCPTLVVMVLDSPGASLRTTEMVAEAIPNARLAMVPDAGYMASSASRRMVDRLIAAHLTSVDRPEPGRSAWH